MSTPSLLAIPSAIDSRSNVGSPISSRAPDHRPAGNRSLFEPASQVPAQPEPFNAVAGEFLNDWNDLFNAVKERLACTVASAPCDSTAEADHGVDQLSRVVLECVAALEHLQASASAELARREGLETAVFEAQTSLAQVRAALVGSRQAIPRATG